MVVYSLHIYSILSFYLSTISMMKVVPMRTGRTGRPSFQNPKSKIPKSAAPQIKVHRNDSQRVQKHVNIRGGFLEPQLMERKRENSENLDSSPILNILVPPAEKVNHFCHLNCETRRRTCDDVGIFCSSKSR